MITEKYPLDIGKYPVSNGYVLVEAANIIVTSIRITGWGMLVMAKISTTRRGNGGRMVLINIRIRTTVVLNSDSISTIIDCYQCSVINIITVSTAIIVIVITAVMHAAIVVFLFFFGFRKIVIVSLIFVFLHLQN